MKTRVLFRFPCLSYCCLGINVDIEYMASSLIVLIFNCETGLLG